MPVRINSNVPGVRGTVGGAERRLRVPLGHLVATRAVDRRLLGRAEGRAFVMACLRRHAGGDWGDLDGHDAEANDLALVTGARILSSYMIPQRIRRDAGVGDGAAGAGAAPGGDSGSGSGRRAAFGDERLWIITEAEDGNGVRPQTTVLFPSDY